MRRGEFIVGTLDECPHCNATDVGVVKVDEGIGPYEFWGQKGWHSAYAYRCAECEEEVEFSQEDEDGPPERDDYEDREERRQLREELWGRQES